MTEESKKDVGGGGRPLRVALAGSVTSSRRTLEALARHPLQLAGVLGLTAARRGSVSGYTRLNDLAESAGAPYLEFSRINDEEIVRVLRSWDLDVLFVVGLSQLVRTEILNLPRLGAVGFHPTRLPEGRGRAPLAWMILDSVPGAATFFVMNEGVDAGPILVQEPFEVTDEDYPEDLVVRVDEAIDRALDRWLPLLAAGEWEPTEQDAARASWYGRRAPEDGMIDWSASAAAIARLTRASSRPHPGAFTFLGGRRMTLWRASELKDSRHRGVIGRIVDITSEGHVLIQTGQGVLEVSELELEHRAQQKLLRVGVKLGFDAALAFEALRRDGKESL